MIIENRGTDEVPFGFIYSDDQERRGYFTIEDETLTIGGSGSGYWPHLTPAELRAGRDRLLVAFNRIAV
jgi:hypothetical protein